MASQNLEFEGTWEEIVQQSARLMGHRVRLTLLDEYISPSVDNDPAEIQNSFWENPSVEDIFSEQGIQPVSDLAAFLDSFTDSNPETDELWEIISDDRKKRRMATHNRS